MAAGEGIETMLSLRCVLPTMPMVAALSASHLAALLFPPTLRRLYIARDHDPAGDGAMASLVDRAHGGRDRGDRACRPGSATSTKICARLGIESFGQLCVRSSRRRTSRASCLADHSRDGGSRLGPNRHRWSARRCLAGSERPRPGLLRGRSDGRRPGPGNGRGLRLFFPVPADAGLSSRDKKAAAPPSSAALRPLAALGCRPGPPAVW